MTSQEQIRDPGSLDAPADPVDYQGGSDGEQPASPGRQGGSGRSRGGRGGVRGGGRRAKNGAGGIDRDAFRPAQIDTQYTYQCDGGWPQQLRDQGGSERGEAQWPVQASQPYAYQQNTQRVNPGASPYQDQYMQQQAAVMRHMQMQEMLQQQMMSMAAAAAAPPSPQGGTQIMAGAMGGSPMPLHPMSPGFSPSFSPGHFAGSPSAGGDVPQVFGRGGAMAYHGYQAYGMGGWGGYQGQGSWYGYGYGGGGGNGRAGGGIGYGYQLQQGSYYGQPQHQRNSQRLKQAESMTEEEIKRMSSPFLTRLLVEMLREGDEGRTRAWHFFERLCLASHADVYQYSVMLNACADSESADKLMARMDASGILPSEVTYQKLYKIYLRDARTDAATQALERLNELMEADGNSRLPDDYTNRVLTDMLLELVKEGSEQSVQKAWNLFNTLRGENKVNIIHYNVMLNTCKRTGDAIALMREAQQQGIACSDRTCVKIAKMYIKEGNMPNVPSMLEAVMKGIRKTRLFDGTLDPDPSSVSFASNATTVQAPPPPDSSAGSSAGSSHPSDARVGEEGAESETCDKVAEKVEAMLNLGTQGEPVPLRVFEPAGEPRV